MRTTGVLTSVHHIGSAKTLPTINVTKSIASRTRTDGDLSGFESSASTECFWGLGRWLFVQRQVEFKHVHTGLAEKTEIGFIDVGAY